MYQINLSDRVGKIREAIIGSLVKSTGIVETHKPNEIQNIQYNLIK